MGLLAEIPSRFTARAGNTVGARAGNTWTSLTSAGSTNTYGSYVSVVSALAFDAYLIVIHLRDQSASGQIRSGLVTIGVDPAGGTSFTDTILHLNCAQAPPGASLGGLTRYVFPLFVQAGSSIGAKFACTTISISMSCSIAAFGRPTKPHLVRCGSYVDTYGADTANSRGTVVTAGTSSEGAWTQIGSSMSRPAWWWQCGTGWADSTMTGGVYDGWDVGVGDASNKDIVIESFEHGTTVSEQQFTYYQPPECQNVFDAAAGNNVYGRVQVSNATADSNPNILVYAVGG